MKVFIVTGSRELAVALRRFITCVHLKVHFEFLLGTFDDTSISRSEWLETELLIVEGMNPNEPNNPVGWRTAKKSRKKVLVFFDLPKKNFKPNEFFICTSIFDLKKKLEGVIKSSPALQKDYESVEKRYPFLTFEPKHHH